MRLFVGHAILVAAFALLAYFVASMIWFFVAGRRKEQVRVVALTSLAYLMVLSSAALWWWCLDRFVLDPDASTKETLVIRIGVALCVATIVLARFAARRTAISIIAGALIIALNWIGSVIYD